MAATELKPKRERSSSKLPVQFDPIRKQLFVESLVLRMDPIDAARTAGFTTNLPRVVKALLDDEEVQQRIESAKAELERYYDVSKDSVLRDLVDAKEIARTMADPKGMVMALKEVSEVQGYHAPKQVSVDQTHTIQSNVKSRMRQIPDHELMEIAQDADFTVVELEPNED